MTVHVDDTSTVYCNQCADNCSSGGPGLETHAEVGAKLAKLLIQKVIEMVNTTAPQSDNQDMYRYMPWPLRFKHR